MRVVWLGLSRAATSKTVLKRKMHPYPTLGDALAEATMDVAER
jgi:hypothetical protein